MYASREDHLDRSGGIMQSLFQYVNIFVEIMETGRDCAGTLARTTPKIVPALALSIKVLTY
jgi:hypothetical protein